MQPNLINKYNVAAPRYTSYPTVPYWQSEAPTESQWAERFNITFTNNSEISLYIHLPFCESLCTYCGCNKRITKNHGVELPYVNALLQEWDMYLEHLPFKPTLKEVHLGGGTPTFFSPEQIERLMKGIFDKANIAEDHAFSFEAHPWSTTKEHLQTFRDLGFNRISIGVQDFEPEILKIINRHQTTEQVENVVNWSRELGYDSINFDLIFGLPLQEPHHIEETMRQVKIMQPDRIAFYSYAHVPWVSPSQRGYSEEHLPLGDKKQFLYELGKKLLQEDGYFEIGLDHFAKATDDLYIALESGTLHRNFMGYTSFHTDLMIGLGASSISDSGTAFVQNEKKIEAYQKRIAQGEIPIIKGHLHSEEDVVIRKHITALMCQHTTSWNDDEAKYFGQIMPRLKDMEADGLVKVLPNQITVTEIGMPFIRNICMAFDQRLWAKKPTTQLFSQVV